MATNSFFVCKSSSSTGSSNLKTLVFASFIDQQYIPFTEDQTNPNNIFYKCTFRDNQNPTTTVKYSSNGIQISENNTLWDLKKYQNNEYDWEQ